jgi:hypothetical protein
VLGVGASTLLSFRKSISHAEGVALLMISWKFYLFRLLDAMIVVVEII